MRLFEEINKASEQFTNIGIAAECIAAHEGNLYKAVVSMLHYRFDELLPCYRKTEFLNFINIDDVEHRESYSAYQILIDIKKEAELHGGVDSNQCYISESLKTKIKDYHWKIDDFGDLEEVEGITNDWIKNGSPTFPELDLIIINKEANQSLNNQNSINEQLKKENEKLKAELVEKEQRIKELELIQTTENESKLGNTRAENNVTKLLLVLAKMADIDVNKPHAIHESLLAQADLLGMDKFPSDETVKKWLIKANNHINN